MTVYDFSSWGGVIFSLLFAPLLPGVINRVKAFVGGRKGKPLLQLYYDLRKLLRKKSVHLGSTTLFFPIVPTVCITTSVVALLLLPFGNARALLSFSGDFILLAGLFCLSRFFLILAALDTGSAFEGMGAAREAFFSALSEPIFLFCLFIFCQQTQQFSLSFLSADIAFLASANWLPCLMLGFSLFLLMLSENSRIPVDDPNTHLELTMIHEVMILDHSGPDLALLEYAAALKLWIFSLLVVAIVTPRAIILLQENWINTPVAAVFYNWFFTLLSIFCIGFLVGLVESLMARLRLERVPQILAMAGAFSVLSALAFRSPM